MSDALLFRKKPVVIEASQWFKNGDHPLDYAEDQHGFEGGELRVFTGAERKANDWEGGVVRYYRHPDVPGDKLCEQCSKPHHVHGWIDTLEQGHRVCPGDWIITGIKGERYPCKPDIFAETYEPSAQEPAPSVAPQVTEAPSLGAGTEAAERPADFDAWSANPYTKVLEKSIAEDYVPRASLPEATAQAPASPSSAHPAGLPLVTSGGGQESGSA